MAKRCLIWILTAFCAAGISLCAVGTPVRAVGNYVSVASRKSAQVVSSKNVDARNRTIAYSAGMPFRTVPYCGTMLIVK